MLHTWEYLKIYLYISDDFSFGSGGKRVTSLSEDFHEVVCKISSSQIQTEDSMG